ncbi:HD domain-containing protein [Winogradskya humida]|uniref:Metal-dependent phosphohydrolase, HD subdomain protein n=1 Tax=Winogradskya humida TaxID=113566 RepID=A0ABQ3ZU50_9ACTN|nr:HD domain-containing protein [Actinoplanes humidus]GIE22135.1 metal-dependent phosphohydrolase, HD subdomain protein [Actinoplanes humidus]
MSLVTWAYEISEQTLAVPLPRRWAHVQGVALKARTFAGAVGDDAELLEAAAVLHDVGYAPDLARTGFHPLDGAYFLQSVDAPRRLVHLVAHHSCAIREARLRGINEELAPFLDEEGPVRDALWACDLTTTPDGTPTEFVDRVAEIKARYGPDDLVTTFIEEATPDLGAAIGRTYERLRTRGAHQSM